MKAYATCFFFGLSIDMHVQTHTDQEARRQGQIKKLQQASATSQINVHRYGQHHPNINITPYINRSSPCPSPSYHSIAFPQQQSPIPLYHVLVATLVFLLFLLPLLSHAPHPQVMQNRNTRRPIHTSSIHTHTLIPPHIKPQDLQQIYT